MIETVAAVVQKALAQQTIVGSVIQVAVEVAVETGYLKKVRQNSPLDYRIVPTQLAWRSPAMFELWRGDSGARLAVHLLDQTAIIACLLGGTASPSPGRRLQSPTRPVS